MKFLGMFVKFWINLKEYKLGRIWLCEMFWECDNFDLLNCVVSDKNKCLKWKFVVCLNFWGF